MEKITILIVEDHKLVRETWSFILRQQPVFEVVGECGSAEEALEEIKNIRPAVIMLDVNLPGINGIEAIQAMLNRSPGSKLLGVSMHTQPAYARQMWQKGASGYVTKNSPKEELFHAIKEIYAGRKYICTEIKDILSTQVMGGEKVKTTVLLSQRELEIIEHIKKGHWSKEIAASLNISVKTVEVHRYNILKKLELKNTAALVNFVNKNYHDIV